MSIHILIADRLDLFREALRRLLETQADLQVIGETGDGERLLKMAAHHRPDVLLFDFDLCNCSGDELLRQIARLQADMRPVLLTDRFRKIATVDVLQHGIRGIIWKHEPPAVLFKGIRSVIAGEYWISRSATCELVQSLRELRVRIQQSEEIRDRNLSSRQQQIIKWITEGCSNKEIARELRISERTVKYHLTRIFSKMGVSGRIQLARHTLKKETETASGIG